MTDSDHKDIDALINRMRGAGEAFAVATVIRTIASTAAKPGMKAVVASSGKMSAGWLGGGCVVSAVQKAAAEAIKDGSPRLVVLRPEELLSDAEQDEIDDHIMVARNGCPSKGSLDIFIEPYLPHAEIIVFGSSPVASALCEIAEKFNYSVLSKNPDDDNAETSVSQSEKADQNDSSENHKNRRRFIVLATQGKGDLTAMREAIQMSAQYIGFVASKKKFSTLRDKLKKEGFGDGQLDQIKAPAGLHIGSVTPEEIALSILAEIIQINRSEFID